MIFSTSLSVVKGLHTIRNCSIRSGAYTASLKSERVTGPGHPCFDRVEDFLLLLIPLPLRSPFEHSKLLRSLAQSVYTTSRYNLNSLVLVGGFSRIPLQFYPDPYSLVYDLLYETVALIHNNL